MEIHSTDKGSLLSITIDGHITGIAEVAQIKDLISSHKQISTVELILNDAFVIPSALIGYLLKLINADEVKVIIKAHRKELKELFSDLNLTSTIEVR